VIFDRSRRVSGVFKSDDGGRISTPGRTSRNPRTSRQYQDEFEFAEMCEDRKNAGYNSGMGEIFRRVAMISPIQTHTTEVCSSPLHTSMQAARAVVGGKEEL